MSATRFLGAVGVLVAALVCGGTLAQMPAPAARLAAAPVDGPVSTLQFRVIDEAGAPVPGAEALLGYLRPYRPQRTLRSPERLYGRTFPASPSGEIRIEDLGSPTQYGQLAIRAPGFEGQTVEFGELQPPLQSVTLRRRDEAAIPPDAALRAVLAAPDGTPVRGATVCVTRVHSSNRSSVTGFRGTDGFAITDAEGRFVMAADPKSFAIDLHVNAPGHPSAVFRAIKLGPQVQTLTLPHGVAVSGRVLREGQPQSHFKVALCMQHEEADGATPSICVESGEDGRFTFPPVAPGGRWVVFAPRPGAAGDSGTWTLKPREIKLETDGEPFDAGDCEAVRCVRLSGRFQSDDDAPLGPGSAWLDSFDTDIEIEATVSADGSFEFAGIAPGPFTLCAGFQNRSWTISPLNRAVPWEGARWLMGTIAADKTDLVVLMQKPAAASRPRPTPDNLPLRGIEPARIDAQ